MKNSEIAAVFTDIAELLKLKKENIFKIRSYQKAARAIEELPVAAAELATEGRLLEVPGVGKAIAKKITEMATTGRLEYYEKLKAEMTTPRFNPSGEPPLVISMTENQEQLQSSEIIPTSDAEAIRHLEQTITAGRHWYLALLEAMALWQTAEEMYQGRNYRYVIAGEAFDWLLLAERLCATIADRLPEDERDALLFHNQPPLELSNREIRKLIGGSKYHQYLNYFYGITTEEALLRVVRDEIRKERHVLHNGVDDENAAYRRIYGMNKADLLKRFRHERGYPQRHSTSLTELKEFTYWLFKYRLDHCDKARVASDTKKALNQLRASSQSRPG